jgi:hypothetical protein
VSGALSRTKSSSNFHLRFILFSSAAASLALLMKPTPLHRCLLGLTAGLFFAPSLAPLLSQPEPPPLPSLAESRVLIPYDELRRLIAAATPPAPIQPPAVPVPACLTHASYQLQFAQDQPQLLATFTVENLTEQWTAVSLGAGHAGLLDPLPATTRLARIKGDLHVLLETQQKLELTLQLFPGADGSFSLQAPPEAALATLTLSAPPADHVITLTYADGRSSRYERACQIGLGDGEGPLRLALGGTDTSPKPPASINSIIISEAVFSTQIAKDGAQLTSLRMQVEHGSAERLSLHLPVGAELLRCSVAGKPTAIQPTGPLALPLASPTAQTGPSEIELSYFLQGEKLHEAEGELTLSLPRSPHLIRLLDWTVELPEGLELTAHPSIERKPTPAPQPHVLQLTRRLCRDSATEARITYRKPNTLR